MNLERLTKAELIRRLEAAGALEPEDRAVVAIDAALRGLSDPSGSAYDGDRFPRFLSDRVRKERRRMIARTLRVVSERYGIRLDEAFDAAGDDLLDVAE